jgi:hypothetical protein
MLPEIQFNWGLGWSIQCWYTPSNLIVDGCRMHAGDLFADFSRKLSCKLEVKWELENKMLLVAMLWHTQQYVCR